jgi:hypothetical protein
MPAIRVSFIDATTQTLLGEADLPDSQLPEAFTADTSLTLGGAEWQVERAEPMTRAEYVASGSLRVVLRRLEQVDPRQLLYSLPTLENALPPIHDGDVSAAFALHEDDWRQRELVTASFEPEVGAELAEIRRVKAERRGVGFERLHVRSRIPAPLAGVTLRIEDVVAQLGDVARRDLAIARSLVDGGFAYVVGAGAIYGRECDGIVHTLALAGPMDPSPLAPLARSHRLLLVDWLAAQVAGQDR